VNTESGPETAKWETLEPVQGKVRNERVPGQIFTARDRVHQRVDKAGAQPENALQMFSTMSVYRKDLKP